MTEIAKKLRPNVSAILNKGTDNIWEKYLDMLYKKNVPMPFEKDGKRFMGIIKGVSKNGTLMVLLEDDTIAEYGIKEVQLLY